MKQHDLKIEMLFREDIDEDLEDSLFTSLFELLEIDDKDYVSKED